MTDLQSWVAPTCVRLADHQRLEAAAGPELDDDAVDRGGHPARTPEVRELGGLREAAPHQLARRMEDPSVDEFVVGHCSCASCRSAR